jgi:malonyl-CoA decarboxylase
MIISNLQPEFNTHWAELIKHDPVHPIDEKKNLVRRFGNDRIIYVMTDNDRPVAILQVALTASAPMTAKSLWNKKEQTDPFLYAVFYSVFRLPDSESVKGGVRELIYGAAEDLRNRFPTLGKFITLSPIPSLRSKFNKQPGIEEIQEFLVAKKDPVARFHISNGASPWAVRRRADLSDLRKQESWGWMASYDYTPVVIKDKQPAELAPVLQNL